MKTLRRASCIGRTRNIVRCVVPLLLATLVTACGGSSDDTSGGGNPPGSGPAPVLDNAQAQTAVVDAVSFGLGSATTALSKVTENASFSNAAIGLGAVAASALTGTTVTTTTGSTANDTLNTTVQQAVDIVAGSMDGFVRVGSTNTYVSSLSADFCDNIVTALSDGSSPAEDATNQQACASFISNVTAELTVIDEDTGTIAIKYQGDTIVTLEYAPDSSARTINLATAVPAYAALAMLLDPTVTVDVPNISGSIMFSDSNNGVLSSSIGSTAIAINGNGFSFNWAAAPQVIKTTVNEATGVTTMEMSVPAINFSLPIESTGGSTQNIVLSTPGMTANANFDESSESMTLSNIGLPLTVTQDGAQAFALTMDTLAMAIDAAGLTFPGGMNINLGAAGTAQTTISALPNTAIGSIEVPSSTAGKSKFILRVDSGSLSSTSSSDPGSDFALTPGCWEIVNEAFAPVACPQ